MSYFHKFKKYFHRIFAFEGGENAYDLDNCILCSNKNVHDNNYYNICSCAHSGGLAVNLCGNASKNSIGHTCCIKYALVTQIVI